MVCYTFITLTAQEYMLLTLSSIWKQANKQTKKGLLIFKITYFQDSLPLIFYMEIA